jgi:hypothetical protein
MYVQVQSVSRAQHVLARVGLSGKLSMYLHWFACIQSSVGIFICGHVLRAFRVSAFVCIC